MRHWLWRMMGVLSLGGGFTGLVFVFIALMNGAALNFWMAITAVLAVVLYGFGVWSGLRLLEGHAGAAQINLLYWWIQIPVLNTPIFGYQFYSGASARVSGSINWDAAGSDTINFGANGAFGSLFEWWFMRDDVPWAFGVNLLACLIVWQGRRLLRREEATKSEFW